MKTKKENADEKMREYLGRIATGPKMSKDLSAEQAEDALSLILKGSASPVRSGIFLIAARMKLETVEENLGFWRALDNTTVKHSLNLDRLLQVADPFDGFNRTPYFGFYVMPVLAAMGLPAYGHSTRALPPKFGITFEDILAGPYQVAQDDDGEKRLRLLQELRFGYLCTRHTHPLLEGLRDLRTEIVKRPMLATLEKMLMPVKTDSGRNFLASGFFHKGYEVPMLTVARESEFDRTVLGNGMEGTTLFGVHKAARVFIDTGKDEPEEMQLTLKGMFDAKTAARVEEAYQELKKEPPRLEPLARAGESALKSNRGPAAPLIACQAGTLCRLFGVATGFQEGFDAAEALLKKGVGYESLMRWVEALS